jgi:hypothetical protein
VLAVELRDKIMDLEVELLHGGEDMGWDEDDKHGPQLWSRDLIHDADSAAYQEADVWSNDMLYYLETEDFN